MKRTMLAVAAIALATSQEISAEEHYWTKSNSDVIGTGDIRWKPEPFKFAKGESVRFIDFEGGSDDNDGLSEKTAWKRHPWDPAAGAKAKECAGIHTYVFKRGTFYRGQLVPKDSGTKENPIRLTSSPDWGDGEATIAGSELVSGWQKGSKQKDIPEKEKTWTAALNFAPRCIWVLHKDGTARRIPLARTPNWKAGDPDDIKSEWWVWDNPRRQFDNFITDKSGKKQNLGIDTKNKAIRITSRTR